MKRKGRLAVFISGRGSNFISIYRHAQKESSNYEVVAVVCDSPNAKGLENAKLWGIDTFVFNPLDYKKKSLYEKEAVDFLLNRQIDLIALAGYMRIVGKTLLKSFEGKILNIHPSLLPAFPGLNAQKQALDYGVKYSGCTVHFVDSGIDTGKIIEQRVVKVYKDDNEDDLADRILKEEHDVYPQVINNYFNKKV